MGVRRRPHPGNFPRACWSRCALERSSRRRRPSSSTACRCHQRHHRAEGREHRTGHDGRLSRRAGSVAATGPTCTTPDSTSRARSCRAGCASRCRARRPLTAASGRRWRSTIWRPSSSACQLAGGGRGHRRRSSTPTPHPSTSSGCARLLRERLPGVAVTASHEITGEWREFERSSTAVLNAYVRPVARLLPASPGDQPPPARCRHQLRNST